MNRACSHVSIAQMGVILNQVDKLHRACSHVSIAQIGIIIKLFKKLHRAHSHVRFAPVGATALYIEESIVNIRS